MARSRKTTASPERVLKCPTGIVGLDNITEGGLPRGRPTLVCGGPGSGKTLLGMEFIVRGITQFGEPGVFVSFEETAEELARNFASLGFDLDGLVRRRKLVVDHVRIERSELEETGPYDLDGLLVRLGTAIDGVKARRVVLDSVEALFAGLPNESILRAELRRLFRWLKDRGLTAIVTGETGDGMPTRHGLGQYVSDCVIYLDHRVSHEIATRRLRVVKYRGSRHGTNEYPTVIDENGLSVTPISAVGLDYPVTSERVSTGVPRLDAMLGGKGFFRGSSILISGTAGTGKSSLAVALADSTCRRGDKCLYLSFEESPEQLVRNMRSIGFHLDRWRRQGRLRISSARPTLHGLEMHLSSIHKQVKEFEPDVVVIDPISNMMRIGDSDEISSLLIRVVAFLKGRGITTLLTSLSASGRVVEQSEGGISSLMDTLLLVRILESSGERNRLICVLKSRGMSHSNQVREFQLTDKGIRLADVYVGPGETLTGSARLVQEARDRARSTLGRQKAQRRLRDLRREEAYRQERRDLAAARKAD